MAPDSTEGWRGPSRGDFLMLPPMKLNAHIPQRLLHPASDYAVTRRSVKVSERTMAHGVDSDFQGMLRISHTTSEQPRAPKSAQTSPDLASRTRAASSVSEDEPATSAGTPMQSFSTPTSAPRKARATQATKPPSPLGSTQRTVNRTIGQPQDRKQTASPSKSTSAPAEENESSELSDTTVSAIMNEVTNSSASPIADQRVRRRDGQSSVISKSTPKPSTAKSVPEKGQTRSTSPEPAPAPDASVAEPATVNTPQPQLSRNGVPVPPELAPAPVAKDQPVAPAEIPLVTRKRSRDSLADPVAVAAAKKIAEAAAIAEVEAKAASERARDMTPVQARPLGSSSGSASEETAASSNKTIAGSIVETTNPSRRETPQIPSGRADISSPRRTAPSVAPVIPAMENAIIEPSQSAPEEIALSARSGPTPESNSSSSAPESRSASAPTSASTAGVQRRATGTPPVAAPPSPAPISSAQPAQGSSPTAGITAPAQGSTASSGVTAQANGSTASSGVTAQANGSTASTGITAQANGSSASTGITAQAAGSSASAGITAERNGSTAADGVPAAAQTSTPAAGNPAYANGSTVSPAIPSSSETVRPSAANDATEVALTARSTPHVDTVAAGSSPAAGISATANGSSTPVAPAMTTNTSTSAAPTTATAQGSTTSPGTIAEAQGSTTAAGVAAAAQGSTVSTPAQRPSEAVRTRDIADAPEVALTARSTPHVNTAAAGSTAATGTPAQAQGSSPTSAPAMIANSSTPASPTRAQAQGSTVAAGSPAVASTSSPSSAGVQRRASADSGSPSAPAAAASDSSSSTEGSSAEGASSVAHRELVRASESPEASDVELVSRSSRDSSAPAAATPAPHVDPVPAVSATSHSVPADVRAAVAAVAGAAPQSMNLKRGSHVDAHASAIKADAFTAKGTVHVPGTAPLTSDSSRRLLAHELTHVVQQQRHGSRLPAENTPAGRALEAEALRAEGLIGMPSPRTGAVAGMPPFSSGSSSPTSSTPSARTSSPAAGTPAVARGSSPTNGIVAQANGSSAAAGNPAIAHGSSAAVGTPAIARGSSPSAPSPVELAPRRPSPTQSPDATSGQHSQPGTYSGGGTPPPGMPPVQRRASGTPSQGSTYDSNMPDIKEAGKVAKATPPAPPAAPAAQQQSPDNTWRDQRWLEQHATALYPLIRNLLRDELLRDRERRGKMMREY